MVQTPLPSLRPGGVEILSHRNKPDTSSLRKDPAEPDSSNALTVFSYKNYTQEIPDQTRSLQKQKSTRILTKCADKAHNANLEYEAQAQGHHASITNLLTFSLLERFLLAHVSRNEGFERCCRPAHGRAQALRTATGPSLRPAQERASSLPAPRQDSAQ